MSDRPLSDNEQAAMEKARDEHYGGDSRYHGRSFETGFEAALAFDRPRIMALETMLEGTEGMARQLEVRAINAENGIKPAVIAPALRDPSEEDWPEPNPDKEMRRSC